MNPDVINGLGSGGQAGHHMRCPLCGSQFHRDQRYQILPAYAQDGIVFSRVFRGSADATVFIAQLLRHCRRWSEPKSVLVMDNERTTQMCRRMG